MPLTPLTTISVRGKEVPVSVTETGRFVAVFGGKRYETDTLEFLRERLSKIAAVGKLKIAVVYFDIHTGRHRTVTGRHASNGNFTINDDTGDREQKMTLPWNALRPLEPQELEEWKLLTAAANGAQNALRTFEAKRKFDLQTIVRQALTDAAAEREVREKKASERT